MIRSFNRVYVYNRAFLTAYTALNGEAKATTFISMRELIFVLLLLIVFFRKLLEIYAV